MGHPEPPEGELAPVEEEVDEVVDPPKDGNGGGDREKPESNYSG